MESDCTLRFFFNALIKSISTLSSQILLCVLHNILSCLVSLKHQVQTKSSSLPSQFLLVFFLSISLVQTMHLYWASVIQGINSVHALSTFQWIHADPGIIIIIITIIITTIITIIVWQVVWDLRYVIH